MLTEAASEKAGLQETTNDQIKVYTEDAAERKWLFKGRLKEVTVSREAGVCIITACFLSETIMLDRQEKSRSFQNIVDRGVRMLQNRWEGHDSGEYGDVIDCNAGGFPLSVLLKK